MAKKVLWHLVKVGILSSSLLLICSAARAEKLPQESANLKTDVLQAPNLVMEPEYTPVEKNKNKNKKEKNNEATEDSTTSLKLQYEPITDELPLLEERTSKELETSGVGFPESNELYVTPEPGITPKEESIEEEQKPQVQTENESKIYE